MWIYNVSIKYLLINTMTLLWQSNFDLLVHHHIYEYLKIQRMKCFGQKLATVTDQMVHFYLLLVSVYRIYGRSSTFWEWIKNCYEFEDILFQRLEYHYIKYAIVRNA